MKHTPISCVTEALSSMSIPQIRTFEQSFPAEFKAACLKAITGREQEVALKFEKSAEEIGLSLQRITELVNAARTQVKGNGHGKHKVVKVAPVVITPKAAKEKGKVAVKYRDPKHPENTWTGRGMKARWLSDALKAGAKLEDFRIGA
jgi:DNA-binding protein H-NS